MIELSYRKSFGLLFVAASLSHAADPLFSYKAEIIAKAQPDECFIALGSDLNEYDKSGLDEQECADCIARNGAPKINQSYVWGLTKKDNYLWWGTGPNVNLLVGGEYFGSSRARISENAPGFAPTTAAECAAHPWATCRAAAEHGDSYFARNGIYDGETLMGTLAPGLGDWRPPDAFRYNLDNDSLERLDLAFTGEAKELLWKTLGLRSAGYTDASGSYTDGLVFLAGPSITATSDDGDGVIMFCFDAATGDLVDAQSFPAYSNIRKWKYYDGQTYTAIATQSGSGQVLKWINDPSDAAYPFEFEVVGEFPAGGAELEVHQGRLYVNTWPGIEGNLDLGPEDLTAIVDLINGTASLWCSPVIPAGGLTAGNANNWTLVWSVVDYEPDVVLSLHYGGGAMASFGDYLYWGTMHVPGTVQLAHALAYGSPTEPTEPEEPGLDATEQEIADYEAALAQYEIDYATFEAEQDEDGDNMYRSISIWRGMPVANSEDDDGNVDGFKVELLYGSETMPVRMARSQFTDYNDPRDEFSTGWAPFFSENLGSLRAVPDNTTQDYWPFYPLPFLSGERPLPDGGDWETVPNTQGFIPKWGPESIRLAYGLYATNNYTWTMQVFKEKLYVGTMDSLGLLGVFTQGGADLFCFPDTESPAVRVTEAGMANISSYGVRTIAADDDRGELYLGMANVQNLLSTKFGDAQDGGWEIQRVTHRFIDDDLDELDDGWETEQFGGLESLNSGSGNADGDAYNDTDEMITGTNPNDPDSFFFTAQGPGEEEGMQQIAWPSATGRFYIVYAATVLGGQWSPVAIYEGTGNPLEHEYDPGASPAKFFRVEATFDDPGALL